MPITKTGDLNQRISFNHVKTTTVNGIPKKTLVKVATVWSAVLKQNLKDRINNIGEGVSDKITFVVRNKLPVQITNEMTISHKGVNYEIMGIEPDTVHNEWKTIICEVIK
ncbi:phage head closure protein [Bacillus velezensis]|uniref:phage head closure protein n=1 Tax=Bacillus velezensis TaxID=492670 RepID=UPI002DB6D9D1|nr:phage head closure protein [Bacillus velezensis]MEC0385438.1 phage head closure protein [Bacillus velezensis]